MSRKLSFGIIGKALLKFISQSKLHRLHSKIMIQSFELLSSMIIDPIIDKKKVKDIQNELCSYGAGKVAIQLMCNTDLNEDLFNSVLDFSTSLVKGGNKQAQNQYYHYLINSGSSIIFFERIHGILVDTIEDNSKVSHSLYKPVYKKSYNSTRNILNFLKELSRHHDKIKSYLNIQENSKESYNVVEDVIFLLEFMLKKMRISNFYLICDCMDWLFVYTTGPNKSYQDIIIDCKFVDLAVRIFYLNENSDDLEDFEIFGRKQANVMNDEEVEHIKGWMISIIKYKCMRIIMNSLEGRDDNYHIAKMIRIFSFELLEENLVNVYSNYVRYYGKKVYNSDVFKHYALDTIKIEDYHRIVIETGFMIYELIQHFHDTCHSKTLKFDFGETIVDPYNSHLPSLWKFLLIPFVIFKQHQKSRQKLTSNKRVLLEKAYSFFKKHTGNIEIVYDKCKLYKIYFILPPEFQGLNQSIKNKFHLEVDRTSNHTKLQFLIDESKDIIDQIKHEQRLHRLFSKYNMFSIVTFNVILWQDVTFVLTVLINFLMVYSYSDYNNQDPDKPKLFYHDLSTYDTLVTFRTLGTFLVISSLMALIISLIKEVPIIAKRIFISKILANKSLFRMKYRDIAINLKHTYLTILSILNQKNILFSLIFLVFAILGTIYHPFFFSVVLLMAVVSKYHTLKHIINAFYVSKSTLIATFILMILIIYVFSIIGYAVLTSDFTGHCPSLLVC